MATTGTLVIVRHGESNYNLMNRFAGWVDATLTEKGRAQAVQAGKQLATKGFVPDMVFTSTLVRAIDTAKEMLAAMGQTDATLNQRESLLERHYGGLTGMDKAQAKAEFGDELFLQYRRSFDQPPPALSPESSYHPANPAAGDKVIGLPPNGQGTESLKDVVERVLPYWQTELLPLLQQGKNVMISAHGNSLRALSMIIERMTPDEVRGYEMQNAQPIILRIASAPGSAEWVLESKEILA